MSTCCPSGNYYMRRFGWLTSYYSPGVCPSDYKSCAPWTALASAADETVVMCCPSRHACPTSAPDDSNCALWCQSLLTTETPVTVLGGLSNQEVVSTRTFTPEVGPGSSLYAAAWPIQVRFMAADLTTTAGGDTVVVPTLATSAASSALVAYTAPSMSMPTTSSSTSLVHKRWHFSRGDENVRLGIGSGLGLFALIFTLALLCWIGCHNAKLQRRRGNAELGRRRRNETIAVADEAATSAATPSGPSAPRQSAASVPHARGGSNPPASDAISLPVPVRLRDWPLDH